jgi:hypothetical protein
VSEFTNAPTCERCWVDRHATTTEESTTVPIPTRRADGFTPARVCGFCGNPTWAGILERVALSEVPFLGNEIRTTP